MRITSISDPTLVNCNYRTYQPLMALRRLGHEFFVNRLGERTYDMRTLMSSDVVHIHRYHGSDVQQLVEHLRAHGKAIVWDNDDDITALPRSNPLYQRFGGVRLVRVRADVRQMCRLADVVTTPSEVLAERFRQLGADDVRVLENCVADHYLDVKPAKHDGITIGWLAGVEHQVDHQQLRLEQVLARLLDTHPDVRVTSIGLGLGLDSERYRRIGLLRWLTELAPAIAEFDIGIAPLVDDPFNQARSDIKLKEYGSVSVPWLASPVGPYRGLGEREGGQLVGDRDWYGALDALVRHPRRRRKLGKRGRGWAADNTISKQARRWMAVLDDVVEIARARAQPHTRAMAR